MDINLNLGIWNGVFAVPCVITDKYLKLAGETQLKVLLYVLRHSEKSIDCDELSKQLNISEFDVEDALGFWASCGVFEPAGKSLFKTQDNSALKTDTHYLNESEKPENKNKRIVSRTQKPDTGYVVNRIAEDPEIASLMQEAEIILSRPLSSGDSASLIMMHDTDGLPADVILMIMQYSCGIGKGMKYIESLSASWSAEGIDTLEKAEEKIRQISESNEAYRIVEETFGLDRHSPTAKEKENAKRWIMEWGFKRELLREAYEICVNSKGKYLPNYVNKILEKWQACGITTLEQVKNETKTSKTDKSNSSGVSQPSYNISEYENSSMFDD